MMTKNVVLALCLALASADPALRGSAYPADDSTTPASSSSRQGRCTTWPNCGGIGSGKPRATDSIVEKKPPIVNGHEDGYARDQPAYPLPD